MKVIITKNYEELGQLTSEYLLGLMLSKQSRINIAITAGTTPKEVYRCLIPKVKGKDYLGHVHYYNFDEIPLKVTKAAGITMRDLNKLFYIPADIPASILKMHPNLTIIMDEEAALLRAIFIMLMKGERLIISATGGDSIHCIAPISAWYLLFAWSSLGCQKQILHNTETGEICQSSPAFFCLSKNLYEIKITPDFLWFQSALYPKKESRCFS